MDKPVDSEQKTTLLCELTHGQELAKELLSHLHSTSSAENKRLLISEILSTYEKSLSLLNKFDSVRTNKLTKSRAFMESPNQNPTENSSVVFNKRKTRMPSWTEKVRVTGFEGEIDDGYSWRKYGQKDILGANYPRGYYRCTHRKAQGCLATKQVQRSNKEPQIFEVNYNGQHTCHQASKLSTSSKQLTKEDQFQENKEASFGLETEDLNNEIGSQKDNIFPSFSFPSPIETENINSQMFNEPAIEFENSLMGSFSSTFISEIPSNQTSVTNSPIGDWDFTLDFVDIDFDFPFVNQGSFHSALYP